MPRSIREYGAPEAGRSPIALPASPLGAAGRLPSGIAGGALLALVGVTALLAPLLVTSDPFELAGPPLSPPSAAHPMGTDNLGRDLLAGVLYGARTSLAIAATVGALMFAIGAAVGLAAGYRGGWLDDLLMRATELVQVLPRFFLVVVAIALLGPGVDRLVLVVGLTSWPALARVVRSEVISLRQLDFIRAAEATGASEIRILWRELLPNVMPSALVMVGLGVGQVLLVEASLGFLGLGDPNALSWGTLAGQAQGYLRVAWWMAAFPGLAITTAVLAVNLLADALAAPPR